MKVQDTPEYLMKIITNFWLSKSPSSLVKLHHGLKINIGDYLTVNKIRKPKASFFFKGNTYSLPTQFQNNVDIMSIFKKPMETYDIDMIQTSMNVNLLGCLLPMVFLGHQTFRYNLAGPNTSILSVHNFIAISKSSL